MVGILDVAPVPRLVEVDGVEVDVPGVSAEGIAYLLDMFPQFAELQQLIGSGKQKDLVTALVGLGPKVLHHILAAGLGYPGNEKAVARVARMDLTAQADVLDAVLQKTMSKGLDHFLERVRSIRATLTPPKTLADKVQEAVREEARKKKLSSSASSSSLDGQGTQPATSGA